MAEGLFTFGSLRNRLVIILTGGAALLAIVLFLVVRGYAAQIAQDGQDSILSASVSSVLDAAVLRDIQTPGGSVVLPMAYTAWLPSSANSSGRTSNVGGLTSKTETRLPSTLPRDIAGVRKTKVADLKPADFPVKASAL